MLPMDEDCAQPLYVQPPVHSHLYKDLVHSTLCTA